MPNSIPKLLTALDVTLADVATWCRASRPSVAAWKLDKWGPSVPRRRALVVAVRKHAARLLALAERVEREGLPSRFADWTKDNIEVLETVRASEVAGAADFVRGVRRGARGRRRVPAKVR